MTQVILLNWVEPSGTSKGGESNRSQNSQRTFITAERVSDGGGKEQYQKLRRFLIVKAFKGHCLCLPINTYSGQGVNKHGVHADNHAVIYSSETGPVLLPGEESKLTRPAIMMVPSLPQNKLHDASRLNYAKVYTIEYNVKVRFIGRIHANSVYHVAAAFNEIHTSLKPFDGAIDTSSTGDSSQSSRRELCGR
ncbi:hypothetical protein HYALB_00008861 [Hymenoscyphus albidus]|uniref:DUF6590 domain-containing protein n=1 Tax=Hymenoscyphus albidus TaxID=595503 RepID=A0A9N9Q286_9HELO|nr:hypothetical protein HYALB_00008861 [Hymenoscyphus albidus]